jgi:hypothetical protein
MLRLVPDSGAGGLVLFRHTVSQLPPLHKEGRMELTTLTERSLVQQATVRELRIGTAMLRDVPAVIVERHGTSSAEGDGLLPLSLFEYVTFDGPRRLLTVGRAR